MSKKAKQRAVAGRKHRVGYGSPPASTRFAPGQSGNPKGRRKGAKNFKTLIAEQLERKIWIVEDGHRRKISFREAIIRQLCAKAVKGDLKSMLHLLAIESELPPRPAENDSTQSNDGDYTDAMRVYEQMCRIGRRNR